MIVGIYNPSMVYALQLPSVLSQRVRFMFTLDILSVVGLCYTYKYPIGISSQQGVISLSVDSSRKISQRAKQGCDPSEDLLYINPLEASS